MKAFRVKKIQEKTGAISFEFILMAKCRQVTLEYHAQELKALIHFDFVEGDSYTLYKEMYKMEYELFKSRYYKFIQSDKLFYNLSDFSFIYK